MKASRIGERQSALRRYRVEAGRFLRRLFPAVGRWLWIPSARLCSHTEVHSSGASFQGSADPEPPQEFVPLLFADDPASLAYFERFEVLGRTIGRLREQPGILTLEDADVVMPQNIHRWRGRVFQEAILGKNVLTNPKYAFALESVPFRRRRHTGEGVLLSMPYWHNFYHWMLDMLPRMSLVDGEPDLADVPLVVPARSPRFVFETLELAGLSKRIRPLADGVWRFDRLHLPTRLSPTRRTTLEAVRWLREHYLPAGVPDGDRLLYVSRRDAGIRFVTNEREVEGLLAGYGFETVCMSEHPFAEQVRCFSNARFVVGSHGAAFSHLAFVPDGATFIELFQEGHFNPCFFHLAAARGLRYGVAVAAKEGLGLRVDVERLRRLVERALVA